MIERREWEELHVFKRIEGEDMAEDKIIDDMLRIRGHKAAIATDVRRVRVLHCRLPAGVLGQDFIAYRPVML